MSAIKDYDITYKILVLGDSGVGKTCLIRRFTDDDFTDSFLSTIGIDAKSKIVTIENTKLRLQIWDTAGQERFRTLTSAYFRGAMGILLVYDVTSDTSFINIKNWLENIVRNAVNDVCIVIVGNKSDASMEERCITSACGKERAEEMTYKFYETSAKSGENVTQVFMDLALQIMQQKKSKENRQSFRDLSPFQGNGKDGSQSSCC